MTVRQEGRLADGREILYYDREPGPPRAARDQRADLSPVRTASEVRWDPLFADYTVIAGHRQSRTYKPPVDLCPLCPSRDGRSTEIPADDYEVAVFENRFPSFSRQPDEAMPWVDAPLLWSGSGVGRCEVVCFTSEHSRSFSQLTPRHARTVIDAWADRTETLSRVESIEYVFCFENRGEEIGATLSHPHGQIYGYPFVPPRFSRAGESARQHHDRTGGCLQCELLEGELKADDRIVTESEHWVCYVPFAARWPYEVRIVPREHLPDLPALSDAQRDDLGGSYLDVLHRFEHLFDTPAPYIAGWQQAPVRQDRNAWHLAGEVFTIRRAPGKLKYLAASESAAALWINDVAPEDAAEALRAAGARR